MKPIDRLLGIMAQLRDKDKGCPWDVEQTFATIVPHTLEEAYEVADAVERNDMTALKEELGDLLLQVVFHTQMAHEQKLFDFDDVAKGIGDKLVHRHPHVFSGGKKLKTAADQVDSWEKLKKEEKSVKPKGKRPGQKAETTLEGVPLSLPSLSRALKLQKRAAREGFDWANLEAVFEKIEEEKEELLHVMAHDDSPEGRLEEMGDLLFSCVNLARKLGVDPEEAVRFCNRKFESRFHYIEKALDAQHRMLADASLQELNDLWDEAKIAEQSGT